MLDLDLGVGGMGETERAFEGCSDNICKEYIVTWRSEMDCPEGHQIASAVGRAGAHRYRVYVSYLLVPGASPPHPLSLTSPPSPGL